MKNNPYYFIGPNPTCDLVIMTPEKQFLLGKRSELSNACPNMWALMGGFINTTAQRHEQWKPGEEEPEDAAKRETKEEANLSLDKDVEVFLIGVYEGSNRDPRDNEISWSKSYAFLTLLEPSVYYAQKEQLKGMDDMKEVGLFTIEQIMNMDLAFDHKKIFVDALKKYDDKIKQYMSTIN
jgi:8-oxo-dGTP diphosphatase